MHLSGRTAAVLAMGLTSASLGGGGAIGLGLASVVVAAGTPAPSSGSTSRIAFAGVAADATSRIYVMDTNGQNVNAVTSGPHDRAPSWSPDGQQIAFTRGVGPIYRIFVINADDASGSSLRQLTNGPRDGQPAWSPDGSRIAFLRTQADSASTVTIVVMNADGSNQIDTGVQDAAGGDRLSWSPDSRRIVYTSLVPGAGNVGLDNDLYRLFTMSADGTGPTAIVTNTCSPYGALQPDWSPDGTEISFFCEAQGANAWNAVVTPSGGGFTKLSMSQGTYSSWSPDSTQIAVAGSGIGGMVILSLSGGAPRTLSNLGNFTAVEPDWGMSGPCTGLIGRVTDGHSDDLSSIRVQLYDRLDPVGSFVGTDKEGHYCIPATSGRITGEDFNIRATLADGDHDPALYETWKDGVDGAIFTDVPVVAADVGRTDIDIDFNPTADKPYLPDVAAIHYESNRFIHWLLDTVGVPAAAFVPVTIVTFGSATSESGGGTFYDPSAKKVWLSPSDSTYDQRSVGTDKCPENCEWHELSHHLALMWHIAATDQPACANRIPHAGWPNPSTCDSLQEGFAMWLPTVASLQLDAGRGPDYATPDYSVFGSLEDNSFRPWDLVNINGAQIGREDLAVAQLLWDLGDDTTNETMLLQSWDAAAGLCSSFFGARDQIGIGGIPLLQLMGQSPPQTVADLYDLLQVTSTIDPRLRRATLDITADGQPDMGHGFNVVPDATNPCYRLGSPVSRTDHVPAAGGGLVQRRDEPLLPGSAIRFVNAGSVPATFALDVTYPSTSSHFEIAVPAQSSKLIHFEVPSYWSQALAAGAPLPDCGANDKARVVTLKLSGPGLPDKTLDNCEYLHDVAQSTDGSALSFGAVAQPSGAPSGLPTTAPSAPTSVGPSTPTVGVIAAATLAVLIAALFVVGIVVRRRRRRIS